MFCLSSWINNMLSLIEYAINLLKFILFKLNILILPFLCISFNVM